MYNDREKLTHHRRLFNEEFAVTDLCLLAEKAPRHPRLAEFGRSPRRYASEILLALLDVVSWDDIVQHRFKASVTEAPPVETEETAPEETKAPKKAEKKSSRKKKSSQA